MRVLIADDQGGRALALADSLSSEDDIAYVGTANCAQSAYELTNALEPDVVVMARRIDDGNGIAATAELKYRFPQLRVIVLTDVFDTEFVPRAAAARASALLPEDGDLTEMLDVIRDEDSDEFYVNPRVYTSLATQKACGSSRARVLRRLARAAS